MKKKINTCFLRIILLYLIIPILIALCLYPVLPKILNYPPESVDNQFQVEFDHCKVILEREYYSGGCSRCFGKMALKVEPICS